jgi:hypothetical protein
MESPIQEMQSEILLRLGDIIKIKDPSNEILHGNTYFIEYIDKFKMKLIHIDSYDKQVLEIMPDGTIGDGNIESITIISSHPQSGFARQNDLLPNTWINIYFGGDIPAILTGKITNLEEDMIEIQTTDNETIYINFAYQGIPEDLPIEMFEIRDAPIGKNVDIVEVETDKKIIENAVIKPTQDMKLDIEFGDLIDVEEQVNINKDKYRFNLEAQTNDLMEDMLSNIPVNRRTNKALNNLHVMITRFVQLRQIASIMDKNNNVTGVIRRTAEDRPLANYLTECKNPPSWILFVAKNTKKIYDDIDKPNTDDVAFINNTDDLTQFTGLYTQLNTARYFRPKLSQFTYGSFHDLMTPYLPVQINDSNNVFSTSNGIILDTNVQENMNVVIDNLGDFYSSIAKESKYSTSREYAYELKSKRFVMQRYNLAANRLHADSFKGQHLITKRIPVAESDPIAIRSVLTLPEPAVRFSSVYLPGSNLLVRSNLNHQFMNYWQILTDKTYVTSVPITGLDIELNYDEYNFMDSIKQYYLDLTEFQKPETQTQTNKEIFEIFLKTIIPKTRVLFHLVKKYITGRLSLVDVVRFMEPFMVYPSDLTYRQYKEINSFIYHKIKEYNSAFKENSGAFSMLKYDGVKKKSVYYFENPLYEIVESTSFPHLKSKVMEQYGFSEPKMTISGSEFLKGAIHADFGNFYHTSVAFLNLELMFPEQLSQIIENDAKLMKLKKDDLCTQFVIAKKYISKESLEADNGKVIYYDKIFDTTDYNLINDKYKKESNSLSAEDFLLFLTAEFEKKNKLSPSDAEHMALTLIQQAKPVREGDYAMLVKATSDSAFEMEDIMADQMEYYARKNNNWVLDSKIDPKSFMTDDDALCNVNAQCVYTDECTSIANTKTNAMQNALKQIMTQFDAKYEITKKQLNEQITKQLIHYEQIFDQLQKLKQKQHFQYNDIQYTIGLSLANEVNQIVVSPNAKLKDLILGQNDFIKKQRDIIQFVSLFCYEGNPATPNANDGEMEDEWWLYCKETNTKLLPKFYSILAFTFINNASKYEETLEELKRKIGKRSDDGDAWVDEHSGEIICYIDLDDTEGYKDGFVDKSRAIIEKDAVELIGDQKKEKRYSKEGEIISNIVSTIADNMGIQIEHIREFIIRIVGDLINDSKIVMKEKDYLKKEQEESKKGKKIPTYDNYYGSYIMYLTLGAFIIAVQTSVPSIRTKKTAPGCVRSFSGFPMEGEGDLTSVTYVSCVALKSRDRNTPPWNTLEKMNESKMTDNIKSAIIRFLLKHPEVEQKMKFKTEYLLVYQEDILPEEHNVNKWIHFLPPLRQFHINHLSGITDGFEKELQKDIQFGKKEQFDKILVLKSKCFAYSLAMQEHIQLIVEKKDVLLKSAGQPFIDNACCNDSTNETATTLQYFAAEDKEIQLCQEMVSRFSAMLNDIRSVITPQIYLSSQLTKRTFPNIPDVFSEENIYQSFIVLCKFHSTTPISDKLSNLCGEKPDYLKKMDPIQEKIAKLKNDGRNYTSAQFLRLFQIVSENNIIKLSFQTDSPITAHSVIQNIRNAKTLSGHLDHLLNQNDVPLNEEEDSKEIKAFKNYLQTQNSAMRDTILSFISKKDSVKQFLDTLGSWHSPEDIARNANIRISDDSLDNYVYFMKNIVEIMVVTFPLIILNSQEHNMDKTSSLVRQWDVSKMHYNSLKEKNDQYYKPLEKFIGNSTLRKLLQNIQIRSKEIYTLSKATGLTTGIKRKNKNIIDHKITYWLYEYYVLRVLNDYIDLSNEPQMIVREELTTDGMLDSELTNGHKMTLNKETMRLLIEYLNIIIKCKKTAKMSYNDIANEIFQLKETEKYDFTDKLKDMSDEQREVDNIMKFNKLEFYGMFDDIRGYNDEHYQHDKQIAENVARLRNKNGSQMDDFIIDEDEYERREEAFIEEDNVIKKKADNDVSDDEDNWDNDDNDYAEFGNDD